MATFPELAGSGLRWMHGAFHFVGVVPGAHALSNFLSRARN
jgi:hypothetical protein